MEFVINGVVKYNSSDGTLLVPDHSMDMITLTRITNELLILFISKNNISLSRTEILNELWESKGLSSSSNNLNNYISMLRKALEQCGCVGLITTIPKYGFIFEADVVLVSEAPPPSVYEKLIEKKSIKSHYFFHKIEEKQDNHTISSNKKMWWGGGVIFTLLVFTSPEVYNYFRLQFERNEIIKVNNCSVYTIDRKMIEDNSKESLGIIRAKVIELGLNCEKKTIIYYFSENMIDPLGHKYFLRTLSYCPYKSKYPCENYYY